MTRWLFSPVAEQAPIIEQLSPSGFGIPEACRMRTSNTFEYNDLIFLIGAARSGTTWLGKIFDSHPNVILRNEPDVLLWNDKFPILCDEADWDRYRNEAREYVTDLIKVRGLKAAGVPPIFPKHFHRPTSHWLRLCMIYGLQLGDFVTAHAQWANRVPIADLIDPRLPAPRMVIKSVSARGRAKLFLDALPLSKAILILRHPCAQVASLLRGLALGKMRDPSKWLSELLVTSQAAALGLTAENFEPLSLVQKLAWHWAIINQKAMDDLAGEPRAKTVRYEDIVEQPGPSVKELFKFADLSWNRQTELFLHQSMTFQGAARYFSVWRDAVNITNNWRNELSTPDQAEVLQIARNLPVGRLYV